MGGSAPDAKGGITTERQLIDPQITGQVQDSFSNTLGGLNSQITGLPSSMQYAGAFEPGALNLKEMKDFSYSKTLDPLVQSQLSGAYQETAQALQAKNKNIAESLRRAPGNNQALIASMQEDNSREASLQANPYRQQALQSQRAMDAEKYGLNLQGTSLTNQARLGEWTSEADKAKINAGIMAQNNQTRIGALTPQMQMFGMLGQGLMQTSPRAQASLTLDDVRALRDDPELMKMALGAGVIDKDTLARAGISGDLQFPVFGSSGTNKNWSALGGSLTAKDQLAIQRGMMS